jgi:hypothetical protein
MADFRTADLFFPEFAWGKVCHHVRGHHSMSLRIFRAGRFRVAEGGAGREEPGVLSDLSRLLESTFFRPGKRFKEKGDVTPQAPGVRQEHFRHVRDTAPLRFVSRRRDRSESLAPPFEQEKEALPLRRGRTFQQVPESILVAGGAAESHGRGRFRGGQRSLAEEARKKSGSFAPR